MVLVSEVSDGHIVVVVSEWFVLRSSVLFVDCSCLVGMHFPLVMICCCVLC